MKNDNTRYWIGFLLIIVGILFIFKNFNVPFFGDIDVFQFVIPLLLLFWAYESLKKGKHILSLILGLVGTSMLFESLGLQFLGFSLLGKLLVPGIFIVIGYTILMRGQKQNISKPSDTSFKTTPTESVYYSSGAEISADSSDRIEPNYSNPSQDSSETNPSKGTSNANAAPNATSGQRQISTVFSSQRVYYTKADFKPGDNYLDASCVFGDLDLIFTRDIQLTIDANVTMADLNFLGNKVGGIMNKFQESFTESSSDVRVHISLSVVFGDVDIHHTK